LLKSKGNIHREGFWDLLRLFWTAYQLVEWSGKNLLMRSIGKMDSAFFVRKPIDQGAEQTTTLLMKSQDFSIFVPLTPAILYGQASIRSRSKDIAM
jgi:hypothetical protein